MVIGTRPWPPDSTTPQPRRPSHTHMHPSPSKRTHLIGDLAHAGVVDGAGVGGGAGHEELGAEERGGLLLFFFCVGVGVGGEKKKKKEKRAAVSRFGGLFFIFLVGLFCGWFGREAAS